MANEIPKMNTDEIISATLDTYVGTAPHKHHNKDTDGCSITPHADLCDQALKHYEEMSDEACHYNSLIPKAIAFYKKHGGEIKVANRIGGDNEHNQHDNSGD